NPNLGWDYDPNDPCAYSWTWGDAHTQSVTVESSTIKVREISISQDVGITSVGNPVWQQAYDGDGNPMGNTTEKPIADAINSSQNPREFDLHVILGSYPDVPPADLRTECLWKIDGQTGGLGPMGIEGFDGLTGTVDLLVPSTVGKYSVNLEFTFKNGFDIIGTQVVDLSEFYVILRGGPSDNKGQIFLEKACSWGAGASDDATACFIMAEGIYSQSGWLYRDNGSATRWVELVNDQSSEGNCVDFANVWDFLCKVLGVNGTQPSDRHYGANNTGFVTHSGNSSMDGLPGNAYELGSSYGTRDRWSFGMHQVGRRGSYLYDPTFGKRYQQHSTYVAWNKTVCVDNPSSGVVQVCSAEAPGGTFYYLYLTYLNYVQWAAGNHPWLTDIYDGPYTSPPQEICGEGGPMLADLSGLATGGAGGDGAAWFVGNCADSAIDTDGDGVANVLVVWTDVELTVDDSVLVIATLYDGDEMVSARSSMNLSTFANGSFVAEAGTNTVMFEFSGEDIWRHAYDGPLQIKLLLMDSSSSLLDTLTCETQPLNHLNFGEIPARSFACSDAAVDTNANDLYDYLAVEVSINSSKAMSCQIGGFIASDTTFIAESTGSATLAPGVNFVTLWFSGQEINSAQLDGPFQINTIIYDSLGTPLFGNECMTSTYNYLDFEPKKGKMDGYFDSGQDIDGNGLYDLLRVGCIVTVEDAGDYSLSAWLADGDGNEIGFTESAFAMAKGSDTINLDFEGTQIYENGNDGPFVLSYIVLEKADGSVLNDYRDAYTTNPYSYMSFERPEAPLIALTGSYSDYGVDTDGNGLYNLLTVDVEVTCADGGVAVANAQLVAPDGETILWASAWAPVEAGVPTSVSLDFDGRYIFGTLLDGPYQLQDLMVYHTGDPSQAALIPQAHTTTAYEYTAFEGAVVLCGYVAEGVTPLPGLLVSISGGDYDYSNAEGYYSLVALTAGTYTVSMESPPGYDPDSWMIYVNDVNVGTGTWLTLQANVGEITQIDFRYIVYGSLVVSDNGAGLEGISIDLYDGLDSLVHLGCTDSEGMCSFDSVKTGSYTVAVIPPLGYIPDLEEFECIITPGEADTAVFNLEPMVIVPTQRSSAYWKRAVSRVKYGNGPDSLTMRYRFPLMVDLMYGHFQNNRAYPIPIFGEHYPGNSSGKVAALLRLLGGSRPKVHDDSIMMYNREPESQTLGNVILDPRAAAIRELTATLLNIVSNKLATFNEIADDGAIVGQVLVYTSGLIYDSEEDNDLEAYELLRDVNYGRSLASGSIPPGTPGISYRPSEPGVMPSATSLAQNYPNPFNPSTEIRFGLPVASSVRLDVYNLLGQRVSTLVDGDYTAGDHSVTWDASSFSSGIYFYRLTSEGFTESRKMLLLK
ncbi:MAG: T9SS type A sorting domain-containing protein, partial [candidate division Zixibacteria bacterium]|nr:T9SS type A sorting domain-containing protein [candidate division Zixibacteria bacterium]